MENTGTLMTFSDALTRLRRIMDFIQPTCEIIEVAGSLRRHRRHIHELELVLIPHEEYHPQTALFPDYQEMKRIPEFSEHVHRLGQIVSGNPSGRHIHIQLTDGMPLHVHMPDRDDFWRIYNLKVGSLRFIQSRIIPAWSRNGWVPTEYGLRKVEDCRKDSSGVWHWKDKTGFIPPAWQSEKEYFEWLEIPYVDPFHR